MSWDLQETYMFGMGEDPKVPFQIAEDVPASWEQGGQIAPGVDSPVIRKADTGANVFDITAMIAGLEADPNARRRT
jgi:hypothetical protein